MSEVKKGRMLMTPDQERDHNQSIIDNFDERHPVGSRAWYWTALVPGSQVYETTIQHAAWLTCAGEIVTMLTGIRGYVSVWHVEPINEDQRLDVRPIWRACGCGRECDDSGFCDDCFGG